MQRIRMVSLVIALGTWATVAGPVWAEEETAGPEGMGAYQRVQKLRETDPQSYQRWVNQQRHRLGQIRQEDPEQFQRIMAKRHQLRQQWQERLKQENPQAYEEVLSCRRQRLEERLDQLEESDPERGRQMFKNRFARLRYLRENNPEKFDEVLANHPQLKERWENWRTHHGHIDRDGNPPGPIGGSGTNWENPPGRRGGPGASPDRSRSQQTRGSAR